MLDTLRLVSSEDVGRDEANVQSLLKKHKDVTDELKNYNSTIETLHKQAEQLGEQDRQAPEVRHFKCILQFMLMSASYPVPYYRVDNFF